MQEIVQQVLIYENMGLSQKVFLVVFIFEGCEKFKYISTT